MLYVAKTGVPWRDLPERFGKWNSVWRRFDRWCTAGVWARLADALNGADLKELHLDFTGIRAQHSAAGHGSAPAKENDADLRRRLARRTPRRTPLNVHTA